MKPYTGSDNLEVMAVAVNYNNFLLALIMDHIRPGINILDIGAGIGTFAKRIISEGYDVLCFEPDSKQAEIIKANGLPLVKSLDEIDTASLDFIYSLNVIEHIADDHCALVSWYSLLKPGGRMLIYVPAFNLLYSSMDKKVGHFRRYKKNELILKTKKAGFKVIHANYADSIGFFASIAYKFFNDGTGDLNQKTLKIYDRYLLPLSLKIDLLLHPFIGKNVYIIVER